MTLTCADFVELFNAWADAMDNNKENLIQLDNAGGDGDLGLAMSDGFNAIRGMLAEKNFGDVGTLLYNAGITMSVYAPSSLGTLLAFGFLEAGKALKEKKSLSGMELGTFLGAIEDGIVKRGKSKLGEKTFIDGFDPAVKVMQAAAGEDEIPDALRTAAQAAYRGSQSTIDMLAKYGRIAVRGEGSRGIIDPGSVVAYILVDAMAETLSKKR